MLYIFPIVFQEKHGSRVSIFAVTSIREKFIEARRLVDMRWDELQSSDDQGRMHWNLYH